MGCGFGFVYSGTLIGIFEGLLKHCGVVCSFFKVSKTIVDFRMAEPRFNNPYFWPPPPSMPGQVSVNAPTAPHFQPCIASLCDCPFSCLASR